MICPWDGYPCDWQGVCDLDVDYSEATEGVHRVPYDAREDLPTAAERNPTLGEVA